MRSTVISPPATVPGGKFSADGSREQIVLVRLYYEEIAYKENIISPNEVCFIIRH